jgi:MFS family permease
VAGASALLGLLVSGALLEAFSWHSIFAFSSALGLVALIAGIRLAPNSKLDRARLDVVGGGLSALGLSTLVYGIIEGPDRGWTDPVTLIAFAIACVLIAATTAIVSSLPTSKQGVASVVNDLAREVGGALGIAMLGAALTDHYQAAVANALSHVPLLSPIKRRTPSQPLSRSPSGSAPRGQRSPHKRSRRSSTASASRC